MKKLYSGGQAPKIRTVTEIIHGKDKLKRDYDLSDFDAKNLNSLQSYNALQIKIVLCHYMATLNTLNLTQPLLTIFRDRNAQREIVTVILASIGFVHNRVNPFINNFDNRMEFVIIENREDIIPGEPILFRQNENDDMVCLIDRVSIMKMLERQFDTEMCINDLAKEKNKIKVMRAFTSAGRKRRRSSSGQPDGRNPWRNYYSDDFGNGGGDDRIKLSEADATRYLTLLFIVEHAYCHYCIFKNYGIHSYIESMSDHTLFASKCRPTMNTSFNNLLLSKFKFSIEESDSLKLNSTKKFVGIINY
ncbi:odv-e27 [Hemileuca sp. nucleopolyhedrovirus]|uniref:Odv-e27 n=1 Tax=Hemileuca sp. nucleopolyhedrovirus TaxID=1367203 RepID=S5MQ80_9ABAC|nr:odv-e27 [Hemileuca sp. nucleopolyhedrovirus]AGR56764.1 odv-e27 [Hemileuca sp. nucleopolyhedrovirus]